MRRKLLNSKIYFFILLFALTALAGFYIPNPTQSQTKDEQTKEDIVETNPNDVPHWLAGSYYDTRDEIIATLMLNNKGALPLVITPTLYSSSGQELQLPPVTVEATTAKYIDLRDWANIGGENFRQGNIRLFYRGKDLVLGAQVYLINDKYGLSSEEKLLELGKFDSRRLDAVWTIPSPTATVKIALTNTSSNQITVNSQLTRISTINGALQTHTLAPHETKLLDLRSDILGGQQTASSSAVSMSFTHTAANWVLLARAVIVDPGNGYSNLAQFANPLTGKTKEYHGAGLQLKTNTGERLKPVVVVKNTASTNATVSVKVPYTRQDGSTRVVDLPNTTVRPNEIKTLNLSAVEQRNRNEDIKSAGIEIRYNTPEGSLLVATHTESVNKRQVFRVPMWDPLRQKTATGGYPWRFEGSSITKTYIKNITPRPQKYTAFINWENGGMYILGLRTIAPHQTIEIDVRDLRDRQVPDENGVVIPNYLTRGQLQWSLRPEEGDISTTDPLSILALLGRTDQIDYEKEISNNYACENCCVNNPIGTRINPDSPEIEYGETITLQAQVLEETCTGIPFEYYDDVGYASWSTSNSNVATVSGGNVTGQGIGEAVIRANFSRIFYVSNPCTGGGEGGPYLVNCPEDYGNVEKEAETKADSAELLPGCGSCQYGGRYNLTASTRVAVKPKVVAIQYREPKSGEFINITDTLYVLKGSTVTFKAIPSPTNATFPTNSPTWSGTSGATGAGQTISVTFNTLSTNITDFKTVTAKTKNPVSINVVVYELNPVLIPYDNFPGRSLTRLGLREKVDLDYTASPSDITLQQIGQLRWNVQLGDGRIENTPELNGKALLEAGVRLDPLVLGLTVVTGASKGNFVPVNLTMVAPASAYMVLLPESNILHCQGKSSAGFVAHIYAEPKDVSFARIFFREGNGIAVATGFYSPRNGYNHPPTAVGLAMGPCDIVRGCFAMQDLVYTGNWDNWTGNWGEGRWVWPIEWKYGFDVLASLEDYRLFKIATHLQTTDAVGTATIRKQEVGPYTKAVADPTSNSNEYTACEIK